MMPYLTEEYGNAGSLHGLGRMSASAILTARYQMAALFGTSPDHVIFTSGGSEGNNMVFKGLQSKLIADGKTHLIVSAIEHDSVLKAAKALEDDGFSVTYVAPDTSGVIQPKQIEEAIRSNTGLVSVMYVNNETGAKNDISAIGGICKKYSLLFHSDCVQAAGQYPIEVDKNGIDFATVSAHKFHGPKGVGALFLRNKSIAPLICGGKEQEFGLRGGTENVPGIVGMGKAAEVVAQNMREDMIFISMLKQRFYMTLCETLKECGLSDGCIHINGPSVVHPGKVLNVQIDGVDGETLLLMLDTKGVCVSAGSACRAREAEPSHVLTAMGLSKDEARSSLRFSFSKFNIDEEIKAAAQITAQCISTLRQLAKE